MSASALPGSRLDWYRAGMMATAVTVCVVFEGPGLETGGTANLTTTARSCTLLHAARALDRGPIVVR
jgi:hypothetical protein